VFCLQLIFLMKAALKMRCLWLIVMWSISFTVKLHGMYIGPPNRLIEYKHFFGIQEVKSFGGFR